MNTIHKIRRVASTSIALATAANLDLTWQRHHSQAARHDLAGRLTVTLTSYPPRYSTLALTLKSLLAQSVRPDKLALWIAECDMATLPEEIHRLQPFGVMILPCSNLRSYKKIVPALNACEGDFLALADDDVYYPRHWLRELIGSHRSGYKEVICTRAYRIRLDSKGVPLPYSHWEGNIAAGPASSLIFPTGIGGVLYEPGIFHPDVTRADLFESLCPTTDDVWLYWMAALNGARFRKVGRRRRPINWANSQHVALSIRNTAADGSGNDKQIAKMIARYGFPNALTLIGIDFRPNPVSSHEM